MYKLTIASITLLLAGCAIQPQPQFQPQPIVQCDSIGIDTTHPDFYQKHKLASIDKYYACMEDQAKEEASNYLQNHPSLANIGQSPASMATALTMSLEYQKNLWHEVIHKEKKPGAAYESWMQWVQDQQKVIAANASANAAANTANAVEGTNRQLHEMQIQQQSQFEKQQQQGMPIYCVNC